MLAVAPFDWQLTDSYFVVAHFHYVLFGGLLFTIFAAIYYWFPKVTGRHARASGSARWHFWLFVIGFNLTFVHAALRRAPRHAAADLHLRRRTRLGDLELICRRSASLFQALAVLIFVVERRRLAAPRRDRAGDDPVGRLDARVGDHLAAARVQLRDACRWCAAAARCGI